MSIFGRTVSWKALAAAVAAMVVIALLPVLTKSPEREITLVTRDMAFFVEGDFDHPNPTLEVRAGEQVRVVLKNQDRGMTHDFGVPALAAATELVNWNQQDELTIAIPDTPGTYEYVCRPHQLMMKGTLIVR